MKKHFYRFAIFLLMVSIFSFFGCKQEPDVPQIPIETENPLSTNLTVTAYPGMNYISWTPVVNAENYTLYIHEGDVCINSKKFNKTEPLFYIDTEIKNNVKYNYLVEVKHSESSKTFFSDKVSTKAIVPEYYEKALNLVEYENPTGNRDFIISPSNIHIAKHNNDKISVSFPSKAYLNYDLFLTVDNEYETLEEFNMQENLSDNAHNDIILYTNFLVTQAGTYKARIVAKAENELYGDSDVITSTQSVQVKKLNGTGGEIISAKYTSLNNIEIKFSYFELENGSEVQKSYYKLYRSEVGSRKFEKVTTSPEYDEITKTYTVEEPINDTSKDYVYTLVVTDGELYSETSSQKTVEQYQRKANFYNEYGNYFDSITLTHDPDPYNSNWNRIELPSIPEKTGCTAYWKDDNGKLYEPNTDFFLQDNTTNFFIEYQRIAYFYDESGNDFEPKIVSYDPDNSEWNKIELLSIREKEFYTAYWKDDDNNLYNPESSIHLNEETIKFTIYYEPIQRTATFYDENGTYLYVTTVSYDAYDSYWNRIQLPSITEKEGYTAYWKDDNDTFYSPNSYYTLENESTRFYIEYQQIYTVEYLSDSYATSFYCEAGKTYSVYWLDSYQGSQELSDLMTQQGISGEPVDINVSIYSADGTQTVCTEIDSGFDTPQTFTANATGDFYIEVLPYGSENTGYFAYSIIEN